MSKLEEILDIPDGQKRLEALIEYASALKINYRKAKKPDGNISENELAVLIYDVEKSRKSSIFQNFGLVLGGIFLIIMVAAAIFLFKYMSGGEE